VGLVLVQVGLVVLVWVHVVVVELLEFEGWELFWVLNLADAVRDVVYVPVLLVLLQLYVLAYYVRVVLLVLERPV
jgi:hypothetical protein